MVSVPCQRCLHFTEEKSLTGYLVSFVPSRWDFYEMQIKLCPKCVKDWVAYYDSLHMEDLRIGKEKHEDYNPKTMSHIHEIIFRDWFLNTKENYESVSQMQTVVDKSSEVK